MRKMMLNGVMIMCLCLITNIVFCSSRCFALGGDGVPNWINVVWEIGKGERNWKGQLIAGVHGCGLSDDTELIQEVVRYVSGPNTGLIVEEGNSRTHYAWKECRNDITWVSDVNVAMEALKGTRE